MDEWMRNANGWASLACAAGLAYVVLSRKVDEGLVVKVGLVIMILGLLATAALTLGSAESWRGLWNAGFCTRAGLLVVIVGIALRARHPKHPRRRATDFAPLDGARRQHHEATP